MKISRFMALAILVPSVGVAACAFGGGGTQKPPPRPSKADLNLHVTLSPSAGGSSSVATPGDQESANDSSGGIHGAMEGTSAGGMATITDAPTPANIKKADGSPSNVMQPEMRPECKPMVDGSRPSGCKERMPMPAQKPARAHPTPGSTPAPMPMPMPMPPDEM